MAPRPVGVYENQPSQARASAGQTWFACAGLATAVFVIFTLNQLFAQRGPGRSGKLTVSRHRPRKPLSSRPEFDLKGRTSDVEVETDADVSNQWIYLNYTLINEDTGQAYDFGREVSYYSGVDSDGSWQEGSRHDRAVLPSIPAGPLLPPHRAGIGRQRRPDRLHRHGNARRACPVRCTCWPSPLCYCPRCWSPGELITSSRCAGRKAIIP